LAYDLVVDSNQRHFRKATPAMNDPMLPLPGLSPVSGKTIVAKFDSGLMSSDGEILALCKVEQRLRVADRIARASKTLARRIRSRIRSPTSLAFGC
jgi:hypothetical protein